MAAMSISAGAATVIGDIVASKRFDDRRAVHDALAAALDRVNVTVEPLQPLEVTIGDEFQGGYATLGDALWASLLVRLELLPEIDTRYGLGLGSFEVLEQGRRGVTQDGPAWWSAREAIVEVKSRERRAGHSRRGRTWFDYGTDRDWSIRTPVRPTPTAATVYAFLACRDELVADLNDRPLRLLRGWLAGRNQTEMATAEGISQSAVSQQLARTGAYAIRDAHADLVAAVS
jgi:hypothetical protein